MKDPIARKIEVTCLIGRKIARQWFYQMSSINPWQSYSWLNEGIATVLSASDVIDKVKILQIFNIILLNNGVFFFKIV